MTVWGKDANGNLIIRWTPIIIGIITVMASVFGTFAVSYYRINIGDTKVNELKCDVKILSTDYAITKTEVAVIKEGQKNLIEGNRVINDKLDKLIERGIK